jgi:hypothetical protein
MVEDAVTNILKPVIVKTNVGSVKHGFWTYYNPYTLTVEKVQEYQVGEIIFEQDYSSPFDSTLLKTKLKQLPHVSNQAPPGVWGKDKTKIPVRYTDLPSDGKGVVPNKKRNTQ